MSEVPSTRGFAQGRTTPTITTLRCILYRGGDEPNSISRARCARRRTRSSCCSTRTSTWASRASRRTPTSRPPSRPSRFVAVTCHTRIASLHKRSVVPRVVCRSRVVTMTGHIRTSSRRANETKRSPSRPAVTPLRVPPARLHVLGADLRRRARRTRAATRWST